MSLQLREFGLAVLILILAWLLSRLSKWIVQFISAKIIGRTRTRLDDVILAAADFPLRAVIIVGGIDMALTQISLIPANWNEPIDKLFFVVYFLIVYVFLYRLIGGLVFWYGREIASKTETELDDRYLDWSPFSAVTASKSVPW